MLLCCLVESADGEAAGPCHTGLRLHTVQAHPDEARPHAAATLLLPWCVSGGPGPQGPHQVTPTGWVSWDLSTPTRWVQRVSGVGCGWGGCPGEQPALGGGRRADPPPGAWATEERHSPSLFLLQGTSVTPVSLGRVTGRVTLWAELGSKRRLCHAGLPSRSVRGCSVQEMRGQGQRVGSRVPQCSFWQEVCLCRGYMCVSLTMHACSWRVVLRGSPWAVWSSLPPWPWCWPPSRQDIWAVPATPSRLQPCGTSGSWVGDSV